MKSSLSIGSALHHQAAEVTTGSNKLALLIPAHNEELVLEATIRGAIEANVARQDIYLVNDSSTDNTQAIAVSLLGADHVLYVERSGKAGAIAKAIEHFNLIANYGWLQILDADSIFAPDYFDLIRRHFKPGVAAVCGQTKSLKNNWITSFRAYEYTISHDFYKSLMGMFNLITIMPGPASCFNTKVLPQLHFATDTLTEDFDLTLQIHHLGLGRIAYEPRAHSFTQDPFSLRVYIKQVSRWYTGFFQVMRKHHVGTRSFKKIDLLLLFLAFDGVIYLAQLGFFIFLTLIHRAHIDPLFLIVSDMAIMLALVLYASVRTKRFDVLAPAPLYYILRILNLTLFFWAAVKIYCLPKKESHGVWNTGRIAQPSVSLMEGGVS
jgi:cellulose synthase/poly-beta-1,6-N-acetylglucosamine synthase-like glycosyltransferase